MNLFEELEKYLNSEEGKKSIERFAEKIENETKTKLNQLERFNSWGNFNEFIEKVITKYSSNKYRDKWYNKGIEPPEELYWFLFEFVKYYGRECNENEWRKHANIFTSELYYYDNYIFNRMDGQGSVIKIINLNFL